MSVFGCFEICSLFAAVILTIILLINRIWPNRSKLINPKGKTLLPKTPSQPQLLHNHLISDNHNTLKTAGHRLQLAWEASSSLFWGMWIKVCKKCSWSLESPDGVWCRQKQVHGPPPLILRCICGMTSSSLQQQYLSSTSTSVGIPHPTFCLQLHQ